MANKPTIYWIDLFCGAGGTSTGIHLADANVKVIACVNHDAEAIKSHYANHPNCRHFTEDIRDWNVIVELKKMVRELREEEPNCIINIWASLECTHFSKAKGGMSRDADSRTLANHLFEYEKHLQPNGIFIENVEEFLTWGPMEQVRKKIKGKMQWKFETPKKKVVWLDEPFEDLVDYCEEAELTPFELPIKERKREYYEAWKNKFKAIGFKYDYRLLNSADFGANTSRLRYFGVFIKDAVDISFPEPTHVEEGKDNPKDLPTWKPVKDVLDLGEEGVSIFGLNGKNKPWATKTMIRVYKGMRKFHESELQYLTSYYGNGTHHSILKPCNTLTTKERYAKVTINKKWLVDTQFNNTGRSIDRPAPTLIARMDKKPLYLISSKCDPTVDNSIEKPGVRPIERLMRYFMRKHNITDVKIRMLFLNELKEIQGFPKDYVLTGTKENKLKFIGNSVVPLMAQRIVEENYSSYAA